MMGKISAWGAAAFGLLFAALAALQFGWGLTPWLVAGTAVLLLLGSLRTLRQMSGGLRLLSGAWGLAAGVLLQSYSTLAPPSPTLHDSYYVVFDPSWTAWLFAALPFIALAGLALTVLHKEQKR